MPYLNTKAFLVIAVLLGLLLAYLTKQEARAAREEQRQAEIRQREQDKRERMRQLEQQTPYFGGMEQDLKKGGIY